MIGCWPASFSSDAASVEKPVFVFFCGVQAELVEQDLAQLRRGVHVELLARRPRRSRSVQRVALGGEPVVAARCSSLDVDADADVLHAGQHADQRHLDLVVQRAQALRVERREQRRRPARSTAERPTGRASSAGVDRLAAEVELALRRAASPSGSSSAGVAARASSSSR